MLKFGTDRVEAYKNLFEGRIALVTAPHISNLPGIRDLETEWYAEKLITRAAEECRAFELRAEAFRLY